VDQLAARLEVLRDAAVKKGLVEQGKPNKYYDRGKSDREVEVGDKCFVAFQV